MKTNIYAPLFFEPVYKEAIWGGTLMNTLERQLPQGENPIGESWEIVDRSDEQSFDKGGIYDGRSLRQLIEQDPQGIVGLGHAADEPFPLLLKIIDAEQDLSLQIHPDEESCKFIEDAEPKTEMWYVLDHAKGARILAGIKDGVDEEHFRSKVNDPEVGDLMNSYDSAKSQAYFIKATTMHAIGGGNLIYEIQQNSNTTYRVSDWGRIGKDGQPRELHVEKAMNCLKYKNEDSVVTPYRVGDFKYYSTSVESHFNIRQLASCEFFHVEEFSLAGKLEVVTSQYSFETLYAVDADLTIVHGDESYFLERGKTCLIPAKAGRYAVESVDKSIFVRSRLA
ncbi:MAG: class I mannose-6-phosphate isomerase [Lentisphaeraceae bacterium]|nr:class I mannose-6-phosphate isomerase [Lentisphaeraceae bacterium]